MYRKQTLNKDRTSSGKTDVELNDQTSKLLSDFAVALNEKCKFESENAVLKLEAQDHKEKLKQLNEQAFSYRQKVQMSEEVINKLVTQLKKFESKFRSDNEKQHKFIESQDNVLKQLTTELAQIKNDLIENKNKLNDNENLVSIYHNKSKMYKEKLKSAVSIISDMNAQIIQGKNNLCDRGSQTQDFIDLIKEKKLNKHTLCIDSEEQSDAGVDFDERLISELFYKENPFMEYNLPTK